MFTDPKEPSYFWQQTTEDIKIWFPLPKSCTKNDIKVAVSEKRVDILLKNETFLSGDTFKHVDSDLTTWNIIDNRYNKKNIWCRGALEERYFGT